MSAFPTSLENELLGDGPSEVPKLAPRAAGYFILIGLATAASAIPALAHLVRSTPGLDDLRDPRHRSRRSRSSSSSACVAKPVVPHDHRLPDPGRDAAPTGARRADRRHPPHSRVAEDAKRLVHPDLQHLQLDARDAGGVGELRTSSSTSPPRTRRAVSRSRDLRPASSFVALNHFLLAPMLHLASGHSLRESGLFSFQSLSTDLVLATLGVGARRVLAREPLADPVRDRPAAADPPLARRAAAPGGGARRPEDRPLQRAPLRDRAERGAGPGAPASSGRCR